MARRFDSFSKPYENSRIPFLLAEVITNGSGEMVDLVCRYVNHTAASLLDLAPNALLNQRFCHSYSLDRLHLLAPIARVAFSGSPTAFFYETLLGRPLQVICYQMMYGVCACILQEPASDGTGVRRIEELLDESLPGGIAVMEVGNGAVRILSCGHRLCELTGYSRQEFLNRFSGNFSALVDPEDWPGLLQELLDASRSGHTLERAFRLVCKTGAPLWISLCAKRISVSPAAAVFHALLLDIDCQHRSQDALAQTQQELEALQTRYDALSGEIPCAACLLRLPAADGGNPEPIWVSSTLCELLGYSQAELYKRLGADPKWRVHPDDRSRFVSLWSTAVSQRQPSFSTTVRMQKKGGTVLWLTLSAAIRPQPDKTAWLYAVYTDVTPEKMLEQSLRYYSELNDLSLLRPGSISMDYDSASDIAHFTSLDVSGRQFIRAVPEYRRTLSAAVHADYRKAVLAKIRAACAKPQRGSFCYLGSYGGQAYRWYQATFLSLADSGGSVCRLLARLEDISAQRAEEERYHRQSGRWAALAESAMAFVRLDLTDNRILDARGETTYLLRVLFGNSAEECLAGIQGNLPVAGDQAEFAEHFFPEPLLNAYREGTSPPALIHRFLVDPQSPRWVRTHAELVKNPQTQHLEAALIVSDIDAQKRRELVLDAMAGQSFDLILTIDTETRRYCSYSAHGALAQSQGPDFYPMALKQIEAHVPQEDRRRLRAAILLPGILQHLKRNSYFDLTVPVQADGGRRYERLCFSLLDTGTLLLTGSDLTRIVEAQQEREQELSNVLADAQMELREKTRLFSQSHGPSPAAQNVSRSLEGRRFLLAVDPATPESTLLPLALEQAGGIVEQVENGLQALQRFSAPPAGAYDAVLLSAHMFVMDGPQTAVSIRNWNKADAKIVPIFLLCAKESENLDKITSEVPSWRAVSDQAAPLLCALQDIFPRSTPANLETPR